jgi:hypothetical protein
MIKLKNLWKIALATMAMSAMLVACDTGSSGSDDNENKGEEKIVAPGGEGVYSYTVNIADISKAWGGSPKSPAFSVVLLTDAQLEACKAASNLKLAPAATPEYQIAGYGNMKIADTSADAGDYALYGATAVNDVYQYYTGVAASFDDSTFTVTVDMTKLVLTDLKALWEGDKEAVMTNDDIVDLKGYKPYVCALSSQTIDADNYVFTAWNTDFMAMTEGATLPANPKKAAPVVPTCKDLKFVAGTINGWTHAALVDNAVTFTAAADTAFAFTNGSWDFKACGVTVEALNTEYKLVEGGENIVFADGVLTAGTEYTATLIVKGNHEAYVKVSAK